MKNLRLIEWVLWLIGGVYWSLTEIPELGYKEVVVPPCRVFYREEVEFVYIVHVCRCERDLRKFMAAN
jgi:hypothetical protein